MGLFDFLFGGSDADDAGYSEQYDAAYDGDEGGESESGISDAEAGDLMDEAHAYELVEQNCAGYNETIYYAFDHDSGVGAIQVHPADDDGTISVIGLSCNVDNDRWASVATDEQILGSLLDEDLD